MYIEIKLEEKKESLVDILLDLIINSLTYVLDMDNEIAGIASNRKRCVVIYLT